MRKIIIILLFASVGLNAQKISTLPTISSLADGSYFYVIETNGVTWTSKKVSKAVSQKELRDSIANHNTRINSKATMAIVNDSLSDHLDLIATKQKISDTASFDASKAYAINTTNVLKNKVYDSLSVHNTKIYQRQKISDSTTWDASKKYVDNMNAVQTGIFDDSISKIRDLANTKLKWSDTSILATQSDLSQVGGGKAGIINSVNGFMKPYGTQKGWVSIDTSNTNPNNSQRVNLNGNLYTNGLVVQGSPRDTNYIKFKGSSNAFYGLNAGLNSISGSASNNVFIGFNAGIGNETGRSNVYIGERAGEVSNAINNVFIGAGIASKNTTGQENVFMGVECASENETGSANTILGYFAGANNITGSYNSYIGSRAGYYNVTGTHNTCSGYGSGQLQFGDYNSCYGYYAGSGKDNNTPGNYNSFFGANSGRVNNLGSYNISLGYGNKSKYNESYMLKIDSKVDSINPFISGDMNADTLRINAQTRFGKSINYTEIASDGTLKLSGTATVWEDDNLDPTTLTGGGTLPSSITWASTNIKIASFVNGATDEVQGTREIPHKCKLGSQIYFHSHWSPTTTNADSIRLGLEYFFSLEGVAVTTSTTIYAHDKAGGTAWAKKTTTFAPITIPNELGTQFHFRFFRDGSNARDTYTGDAATSSIGYHYESDQIGSNGVTTK